jgi:hypothetical protein
VLVGTFIHQVAGIMGIKGEYELPGPDRSRFLVSHPSAMKLRTLSSLVGHPQRRDSVVSHPSAIGEYVSCRRIPERATAVYRCEHGKAAPRSDLLIKNRIDEFQVEALPSSLALLRRAAAACRITAPVTTPTAVAGIIKISA